MFPDHGGTRSHGFLFYLFHLFHFFFHFFSFFWLNFSEKNSPVMCICYWPTVPVLLEFNNWSKKVGQAQRSHSVNIIRISKYKTRAHSIFHKNHSFTLSNSISIKQVVFWKRGTYSRNNLKFNLLQKRLFFIPNILCFFIFPENV